MILAWLISLLLLAAPSAAPQTEEESVDVAGIIFEHIGDEYEWHIMEWKGKAIAIPLPCIVIDNGVHVFTIHHAAENGYTLNETYPGLKRKLKKLSRNEI